MCFGYSGNIKQKGRNILVIGDNEEEDGRMSLPNQLAFGLKNISGIGQQLYIIRFATKEIESFSPNNTKLLMQRYSLISQLDKYTIFGVIVSNTATTFYRTVLERSVSLLKSSGKKTFTFMMSTFSDI